MRFSKLFVLMMLVSVGMFITNSCSNDNSINTSTNDQPEYILYDYNFSEFSMSDATSESDIVIDECLPMRPDLGTGKNPPPYLSNRMMLGKVFAAMKLTDDQKLAVREILQKNVLCEMQWFRKLQAVRDALIQKANAEKRSIMQKVKDGEITREQAARMIEQLNKRVREAIQNHPINEEMKQAIMRCREVLFRSITDLLTEEQLVIWKRFMASVKTN